MKYLEIREETFRNDRHTTFFLESGPRDGTPIIFVHGWPELAVSWRHQLSVFGALGFRAIAPDLRGHGRSALYNVHEAYSQAEIVRDMLDLLDGVGADSAIWVGHDWGAPVVWNLASHHPEKCRAVVGLCVPYATLERGLDALIPLVNRETYPVDQFPYGNWEYMRFYEEHFSKATDAMEADVDATFRALFRSAQPDARGKPSRLSLVRKDGGWFGGIGKAPDVPRDDRVISEQELSLYVSSYKRTGFFGTDSLYMNHKANAEYAAQSVNGGYLDLPVLFLEAEHDYTCDCVTSPLAKPMHSYCRDLSVRRVLSGHWMAQENPQQVNAFIASWLAHRLDHVWP